MPRGCMVNREGLAIQPAEIQFTQAWWPLFWQFEMVICDLLFVSHVTIYYLVLSGYLRVDSEALWT